jgi:hypothetical protein
MTQIDLTTALEQAIEQLARTSSPIAKGVKKDLEAVLRDLTKQQKAK